MRPAKQSSKPSAAKSKVKPARSQQLEPVSAPPAARVAAARQLLGQVRAVLMRFPHVRGVGVGLQHSGGNYTGDIAFVVTVDRKDDPVRPRLESTQHLPKQIFGIPVDVQHVPLARLKMAVAGGGDIRETGRVAAGHIGLMAKTDSGQVLALTAMHVFDDTVAVKPPEAGPYFEVQARMFVGGFQRIGRLYAGEFDGFSDIASVVLDPGVDSSNVLLNTAVILSAPRDATAVAPGITVEIAIPGEDPIQGLFVEYPAQGAFGTSAGLLECHDLMRFRISAPGIAGGWSGSVVFDPASAEPLALLSFGTDGVDAAGFCHAYGFPIAAKYQAWGLQPL